MLEPMIHPLRVIVMAVVEGVERSYGITDAVREMTVPLCFETEASVIDADCVSRVDAAHSLLLRSLPQSVCCPTVSGHF